MGSRFILILFGGLALVLFQNCGGTGKGAMGAGAGAPSAEERVIGDASGYTKVVSDPQMQIPVGLSVASQPQRMEIDIQAGTVSINAATCALDTDHLEALRLLLASSRICEPAPPAAGMAICMAIGLPDIELSNAADVVQLRPVICNFGTFLCDGNDAILRSTLADIRSHLPSACP